LNRRNKRKYRGGGKKGENTVSIYCTGRSLPRKKRKKKWVHKTPLQKRLPGKKEKGGTKDKERVGDLFASSIVT